MPKVTIKLVNGPAQAKLVTTHLLFILLHSQEGKRRREPMAGYMNGQQSREPVPTREEALIGLRQGRSMGGEGGGEE